MTIKGKEQPCISHGSPTLPCCPTQPCSQAFAIMIPDIADSVGALQTGLGNSQAHRYSALCTLYFVLCTPHLSLTNLQIRKHSQCFFRSAFSLVSGLGESELYDNGDDAIEILPCC